MLSEEAPAWTVWALTDAERCVVQDASRIVEYHRRRCIYTPGDHGDNLFILLSGVVKLQIVSPEGRELTLGFLRPGNVFGEHAIADPGPRDHIAEAHEDSVVYSVSGAALRRIPERSPGVGFEVMRLLSLHMTAYRARVKELLYRSALARVAHTLLDLAGHHGVKDAEGVVIPLRLSQRDIANLVGLTRETVNFVLKDLRQRKLLENQGRNIRVRSPEVLDGLR